MSRCAIRCQTYVVYRASIISTCPVLTAVGVRAFVEAMAGHEIDASIEPLVSHFIADD